VTTLAVFRPTCAVCSSIVTLNALFVAYLQRKHDLTC